MVRNRRWCIGVVVPAQNEEGTIARCIRSIREAHAALGGSARLWIVLVADACTDATAARARVALQDQGEVIECDVRCAGAARTEGAAAALSHFRDTRPDDVWLANTDADTHVPLDWLKRQIEFANEGDTGVAGIVELDLEPGVAHSVRDVFRHAYPLGFDGTHTHVHGANLGVRADAYLAVGGWRASALAEDHCLWNRLKAAGWRLRATILIRVTTSARLRGRAPGGFADTLQRHVSNALA
jgi:cellulose synthase/poly-beta-1,6-N-acetylglucosamine synthase-like glycosyltransferase